MKYFKNTSWLFGEKILRMIVGLFVGIWVARYLGPAQFGLFSYAQSFVGLFTAFATLGLDGIVVRELVKDEMRRDELIGTAFWLKLMGALGVLFILAFAVNFTSNDSYTNTLVFIIASATIFQSFNVVDMYFQSKVMGKYIVFANVISLLLSSIVKVVLILNHASLIAFAWTIVFDNVILALGFIYFYIRNRHGELPDSHCEEQSKASFVFFTFSKSTAISLLKDSWPLIFAGIASMINMRVDQVMLGNMTDFSTVGNYAAAIRISELWLILPMLIGSSIYPAIISAKKQGPEIYKRRVRKTVYYMGSFALPFALIVTILSHFIVSLLYGEKYSDAYIYLAIHIWSGLPYVVFFAFSQVAIIEGLTKISLYSSIFAVIANIALNNIFIPIYGGIGAASTSLFVAVSSVGLVVLVVNKKTKIL